MVGFAAGLLVLSTSRVFFLRIRALLGELSLPGLIPMAPYEASPVRTDRDHEPIVPAEPNRVHRAAVAGVAPVPSPHAAGGGESIHGHISTPLAADNRITLWGLIHHRHPATALLWRRGGCGR